ncbi:MAG: hypothetical protein C4334_09700 [Pyrinomonas sp.]|uniref:hypothetical protein n=1 Tax=Pyrinomonas sp. TaxID=2080306 RepID=UPI00332392E8
MGCFAIENLLAVAPKSTQGHLYRTSSGAEIDLSLEVPKRGLWAIEIKRGLALRPERVFHPAREDLKPSRRFSIHPGTDIYHVTEDALVTSPLDAARSLRES